MKKRWYNCWLFHNWGDWQEISFGKQNYSYGVPIGEQIPVLGQKGRCLICGKYKIVAL